MSVCPNCGASISRSTKYCPYCNTANPSVERHFYMKKLFSIKNNTEHISDEALQESRRTFFRMFTSESRIFLLVILILILLSGGFFAYRMIEDQRWKRYSQQVYQFEETYFPIFDEMYEEENYEGLYEYISSLWEKPGSSGTFYWKHYSTLENMFKEQET